MRKILVMGAAMLLGACADPIDTAKEAVKSRALNSRGIEYRNVQALRNDVVCGEFKEEDRWGEGPGFLPFIVRDGVAYLLPSDLDIDIFCSQDPGSALQNELGIGPVNKENTSLVKVYTDLSTLAAALEAYREDFKSYPSTTIDKGLQGLTRSRLGSPDPEDRYLKDIPVDPWGRDYVYRLPRMLHGEKPNFNLYTLGKDGVIGGEGENADVGVQHLAYLDHVGGL